MNSVRRFVAPSAGVRQRPRQGDRLRRPIARIEADHGIQHMRSVQHRPPHRPRGILEHDERRKAGATDQARRYAHADKIVEARRQTDRPTGVFPDADGGKIGGDSRASAGTRPAGVAYKVIGISRLASCRG